MNPAQPVSITKINELAKFIAPGHTIVLPVFGYDLDTKSQLVGCEWAVKSPSGEVVSGNAGTLVLDAAEDAVGVAQNFCNAQAQFLNRAMSKCVPATVEHGQAPLSLQSADLPAPAAVVEEPERPVMAIRRRNRRASAPREEVVQPPAPVEPPVAENPVVVPPPVMEVKPEDIDDETGLPPEDMPQRGEETVPAPALPEAYADDPGEFVITYGRNVRKQLKDVTVAAVEWYANDLAAANHGKPEDLPLIEASRKFLKKLQTQNQ